MKIFYYHVVRWKYFIVKLYIISAYFDRKLIYFDFKYLKDMLDTLTDVNEENKVCEGSLLDNFFCHVVHYLRLVFVGKSN